MQSKIMSKFKSKLSDMLNTQKKDKGRPTTSRLNMSINLHDLGVSSSSRHTGRNSRIDDSAGDQRRPTEPGATVVEDSEE